MNIVNLYFKRNDTISLWETIIYKQINKQSIMDIERAWVHNVCLYRPINIRGYCPLNRSIKLGRVLKYPICVKG